MHPQLFASAIKKQQAEKRYGAVTIADFPTVPTAINTSKVLSPSSPVDKITAKRQSFAAPDFEFKFRQSTDMSSEAQRLMDEVREQANRIKGDLAYHRDEQLRKDSEAEARYGRKIAMPKGKIGRYSDVHKDEFSKMGSIADHASKFRAEESRPTTTLPLLPSTLPAAKSSSPFKVTTVKVPLKPESAAAPSKLPTSALKRSASSKSIAGDVDELVSPAKRRRTNVAGLVRQFETGNLHAPPSTLASSKSPGFGTPTKSSLARSDSVRSLKNTTSSIPTIRPFSTPTATRTSQPQSSTKKARTSFMQRLHSAKSMKSILRRPLLHYSNDPLRLAAGTDVTTPKSFTAQSITDQNIEKVLPDIRTTAPPSPGHRKEKHADYPVSPDAVTKEEPLLPGTPVTPSPTKAISTVVYPTLDIIQDDTSRGPSSPTHAGLLGTRGRASIAGPSDFTFRSNTTISFSPRVNAAAAGLSLTPTIRHVRASDASYLTANVTAASGLAHVPNVPHGLSNKKRKRDSQKEGLLFGDSSLGADKENADETEDVHAGSPTKRVKMSLPKPTPSSGTMTGSSSNSRVTGKSGTASKIPRKNGPPGAKSKSVLSLSRLNALSKPKGRA